MQVDDVAAWFTARADRLGVEVPEVVDVHALSRGVSRQTWSVRLRTGQTCAVRRDHGAGSIIPTPLRTEHDVYRALDGTDVPHARVLWWEDDPDWMPDGRPAYVREMVEGSWRLTGLDDPERRRAAAREHLRVLALVHAVDWRTAGLDRVLRVPTSPGRAATELLDDCAHTLASYDALDTVVVAEALATLRASAPTDLDRLVLVKGTNGHGEEVWRDGRVVAMSDWELAAIGDPAYDLVQCQELFADDAEAVGLYAEATGIEVPAHRMRWYRAVLALLQHVYTSHAAHVVSTMEVAPVRFVWTATEVAFRSELRLAAPYAGDLLTEAVA